MLKISLQVNPFPNSVALNGFQAQSGVKYYIYSDVVNPKVPTHFGLNGVFQTRNESQPPYEYLGSNIAATFQDGTYTIQLKDSTGAIIDSATFICGTIVTPPPSREDLIPYAPGVFGQIDPSTNRMYVKTATREYWALVNPI